MKVLQSTCLTTSSAMFVNRIAVYEEPYFFSMDFSNVGEASRFADSWVCPYCGGHSQRTNLRDGQECSGCGAPV